jgi:branched-chain amino acid transport system permease protein
MTADRNASETAWANMPGPRTNRSGPVLALTALVILAAALPMFAGDYTLLLAGQVAIYVIAIAGLNILTGMTGLISLGHAGFFAVGAYVAAVGSKSAGLPVYVTLPLAISLAAAIGIVVGLPSLRVKGLYLAIATLAANVLIIFIIERDWIAVYTGGVNGIEAPTARLFGQEIMTPRARYWLVAPFAGVAVLLTYNLLRTRIGRAFIAIRDRDYSAEILGISLVRYKLASFALSAAFGGLAGGLWAYYFAALQPSNFGLFLSIQLVAALIIGGQGTVLGPVLGAFMIIVGPEILKLVFSAIAGGDVLIQRYLSPVREILFGALIIIFVIFEPRGMAAVVGKLWTFFRILFTTRTKNS